MEQCSLRSFTTVDSQVVFGRPMGRLTGFTKWRGDCLAGVSGVQISELYRKMLSTNALKIRRRMTSLTCLLSKMFSSVFRLSIARPFLRLISSSVSNKKTSSLYIFVQLLSEILLIPNCSVLVVFINRLFSSSISGTTLST